MGGGFTVGVGMARAFSLSEAEAPRIRRCGRLHVFFHSGMTGAVEIIYNNADMIPVVLDNHITGMAGHQDSPARATTSSARSRRQ